MIIDDTTVKYAYIMTFLIRVSRSCEDIVNSFGFDELDFTYEVIFTSNKLVDEEGVINNDILDNILSDCYDKVLDDYPNLADMLDEASHGIIITNLQQKQIH